MAVPSQGTVAVGDKITASLWNSDVRDGVDFLLSPPTCKVYKTANQSIPDSAYSCLTWNAELFDTDTMHSNTSSNSRVTFTTAGIYQVTLTCLWANNAVGFRYHTIEKNGTTTYNSGTNIIEPFVIGALGATHAGANINFLSPFNAGDYIQVFVYQNSGGAVNLAGVSDAHSSLSALWVSS